MKCDPAVARGIASQLRWLADMIDSAGAVSAFELTWNGQEALIKGPIHMDASAWIKDVIDAQTHLDDIAKAQALASDTAKANN